MNQALHLSSDHVWLLRAFLTSYLPALALARQTKKKHAMDQSRPCIILQRSSFWTHPPFLFAFARWVDDTDTARADQSNTRNALLLWFSGAQRISRSGFFVCAAGCCRSSETKRPAAQRHRQKAAGDAGGWKGGITQWLRGLFTPDRRTGWLVLAVPHPCMHCATDSKIPFHTQKHPTQREWEPTRTRR